MLAPLKRGAAGTYALNKRLKQRLNPSVGREAEQLGVSIGDQAHMHMHMHMHMHTHMHMHMHMLMHMHMKSMQVL